MLQLGMTRGTYHNPDLQVENDLLVPVRAMSIACKTRSLELLIRSPSKDALSLFYRCAPPERWIGWHPYPNVVVPVRYTRSPQAKLHFVSPPLFRLETGVYVARHTKQTEGRPRGMRQKMEGRQPATESRVVSWNMVGSTMVR
jgi:hypothetical protein